MANTGTPANDVVISLNADSIILKGDTIQRTLQDIEDKLQNVGSGTGDTGGGFTEEEIKEFAQDVIDQNTNGYAVQTDIDTQLESYATAQDVTDLNSRVDDISQKGYMTQSEVDTAIEDATKNLVSHENNNDNICISV